MPEPSSPSAPLAPRDRRLVTYAILLAAGVFVLDLQVPLGVAVCALYGLVVLFGLFIGRRSFALWMAAVATLSFEPDLTQSSHFAFNKLTDLHFFEKMSNTQKFPNWRNTHRLSIKQLV